jgi:hypothetical protein
VHDCADKLFVEAIIAINVMMDKNFITVVFKLMTKK